MVMKLLIQTVIRMTITAIYISITILIRRLQIGISTLIKMAGSTTILMEMSLMSRILVPERLIRAVAML